MSFYLNSRNYAASDFYLFFLTNQITQTEFASMNGTQLKDEDDDEHAGANGDAQARHDGPENKVQAGDDQTGHQSPQVTSAVQRWKAQASERRHAQATD